MYLLGKVGMPEQKERFLDADWSGASALGLLHDRAGRRGRRRVRSVDDADHCRARRRSLGGQRTQGVHHGGGRAPRSASSWRNRRPAPHVPGRLARSVDPDRTGAGHDRQFDARRPCRRHDRQSARPRRPDARARRGIHVCPGAAQPGPPVALHALASGPRRARTKSRPPMRSAPCLRQAVDRSRGRRIHARRQSDRPQAGRADDRLVRGCARYRRRSARWRAR